MKRAKANIWNLLLMFVHANLGRDFLNKFRALKTLLLKQICHNFSIYLLLAQTGSWCFGYFRFALGGREKDKL